MTPATTKPVGVLAVGDAYMPAGLFTAAFASLGDAVAVTEPQIAGTEAGEWMLNPVAMIRAVGAVVHESLKPQAAYDRFLGEPGRQASPSP